MSEHGERSFQICGRCLRVNDMVLRIAEFCVEQAADGLRGDITLFKAARAHAAYLGRELQRAEVAARLGLPYRQDAPLDWERVRAATPGG